MYTILEITAIEQFWLGSKAAVILWAWTLTNTAANIVHLFVLTLAVPVDFRVSSCAALSLKACSVSASDSRHLFGLP